MNTIVKKIQLLLLITAIPFFLLAVFTNIAARSGYHVQEQFPFIMGIHVITLLLFFPSLLLTILNSKQNHSQKPKAKDLLKGKPLLLKIPLFLLLPYAMFNFLTSPVGTTLERDGKIYEHSHGTIIREITLEDKRNFERAEVMMFSGHWMVFLFGVILLNYQEKEEEVEGNAQKLSQTNFKDF